MFRFMVVMTDNTVRNTSLQEGELAYITEKLDIIKECLAVDDGPLRTRYSAAMPDVFSRYLQAQALICPETRIRATTKIGLSAIAATPLTVGISEAALSSFKMFVFIYDLLRLHAANKADSLKAINGLVHTYYSDVCFGTTSNLDVGNIRADQTKALSDWLENVITPILAKSESAEELVLAFEGVFLALEASSDTIQIIGHTLFEALAAVPQKASSAGTRLLCQMVSTLARARQLDALFELLSQVKAVAEPRSSSQSVENLLVSTQFQRTLSHTVAQSMPFMQAQATINMLTDRISQLASEAKRNSNIGGEDEDGDNKSSKKRRLSSGKSKGRNASASMHSRAEVLAVTVSNFALSGTTIATTEQQRIQYSALLGASYKAFSNSF
ncbi:hypothetical protein LPJ57_010312, partial [Coemansia sp. RSA 486]